MRHQNNSPTITYLRDIADIYQTEFHMEIIGNAFLCCGDCMCVMAKLPDNCIDSAGLDGPYGIIDWLKLTEYRIVSIRKFTKTESEERKLK